METLAVLLAPLWGESTGDRRIPIKFSIKAELSVAKMLIMQEEFDYLIGKEFCYFEGILQTLRICYLQWHTIWYDIS